MRRKAVTVVILLGGGACGYDWTVVPKSVPAPPNDAACRGNEDCTKDRYCAFADRKCGKGDPGTCTRIPLATECTDQAIEFDCLCTDVVIKTRCIGASNGIDVSLNAPCPYDPGTFRCGFLYCSSADEYCLELGGGTSPDYRCVPWTCQDKTCACPEATSKCPGAMCTTVDGGTVVHCELR